MKYPTIEKVVSNEGDPDGGALKDCVSMLQWLRAELAPHLEGKEGPFSHDALEDLDSVVDEAGAALRGIRPV